MLIVASVLDTAALRIACIIGSGGIETHGRASEGCVERNMQVEILMPNLACRMCSHKGEK